MFLKYGYKNFHTTNNITLGSDYPKKILLKLDWSVIFIVEWDNKKYYPYTKNKRKIVATCPREFEPVSYVLCIYVMTAKPHAEDW